MTFKAQCKARGCAKQAEAQGWAGGRKRVCRVCQRCISHCPCDGFSPITDETDAQVAQDEREQARSDNE